ncbi:MAG: hypothetical protein II049_06140 [Clostridia bacterium]|nr:hypothetical protein [Clostridia bacterium]
MRLVQKIGTAVCLAAAFLLFACGRTETERQPSAPSTAHVQPEQTPRQETPAQVETIELYGQTFTSDQDVLIFSEPIADLGPLSEALDRFPACRCVQLLRSFDSVNTEGGLAAFERTWTELKQSHPEIVFVGQLLIDGEPSETLQRYTVPASAVLSEEIPAVVSLCPALACIDVSEAETTSEAIVSAETAAEGVKLLWTDKAFGASDSDTETLAFSGEQHPETIILYLSCFPKLKEVDLRETSLSEAQLNAISDRFPSVAFRRTVLLNGVPFDSFTEELDLSGETIESYEAFSDAIARFPKLRKLLLHDCSLSDEQLAALRDRYPDAGIVWTVHFSHWRVATDAVAFSTMQSGYTTNRMKTKDVQVLRYCKDLIALDLGHNDISDIEWIRDLQNLQVLILANNWDLVDLSPIGSLKKLKYLELFMCNFSDISPLANLPELLDVNLFITRVEDVTPLLSCKKLERIWLGERVVARVGAEGIQQLVDAFPDAEFDLVSAGSTKLGWREHPRYFAMRQMFEENIAIEPFLP